MGSEQFNAKLNIFEKKIYCSRFGGIWKAYCIMKFWSLVNLTFNHLWSSSIAIKKKEGYLLTKHHTAVWQHLTTCCFVNTSPKNIPNGVGMGNSPSYSIFTRLCATGLSFVLINVTGYIESKISLTISFYAQTSHFIKMECEKCFNVDVRS